MADRWMARNTETGENEVVPAEMIVNSTIVANNISLPADTSHFTLDDHAFINQQRIAIRSDRNYLKKMSSATQRRLERLGVDVDVSFAAKKRPPLLADDVLLTAHRFNIMESKMPARLNQILRGAQRFVLTENAAERIGNAIRLYPELLVENGVFARTPFPTCWIEMPSHRFHEAVVPGSSTPTADIRVGYLFHNDEVFVAAQNATHEGADWSPMSYLLHQPPTLREELALAERLGVSRMLLDNFYWGGTMASNLPRSVIRGLRQQHGIRFHAREGVTALQHDWLGMCAGEVRNIIGLLLMINQPSNIVRTEEVGHKRVMSAKGTRVLMAHSVITLNLDGRSKPSRLFRRPVGSHASPKWHPVIDHWCNDKIARSKGYSIDDPRNFGEERLVGHAHEWEQINEEKLVFKCKICGGRRWRRFMRNGRGDKSRGIVSQERVVKTDVDVEVKDQFFT